MLQSNVMQGRFFRNRVDELYIYSVSSPESAMVTLTEGLPELEPFSSMALMISIPSITLPKTTWRSSSQEVLTVVMKNWLPLVSGPELAIDKMPGPVCFSLKFCKQVKELNIVVGVLFAAAAHLILELLAVDALSAHTVAVGKITTLNHEVGDDAMERSAFEVQRLARSSFPLLASAQCSAQQ